MGKIDCIKTNSVKLLAKALSRLEEALKENPEVNVLAIDGTIHRFENCFELMCVALKKFLTDEGYEVKSPKQALQEAYQMEWIHDEALWIQMLEDRNKTSHSYDDALATKIYSHIGEYHSKMHEVYEILLAI